MSSNVVSLEGERARSVESILDMAKGMDFRHVLVIGSTDKDQLACLTTHLRKPEALWMMRELELSLFTE